MAASPLRCRNTRRVNGRDFLLKCCRSQLFLYKNDTGTQSNLCMPVSLPDSDFTARLFLSGVRVQDESAIAADFREVEHLRDGIGDAIEGSLANALAAQPVVFDEVDDGCLVGEGVVNEILFCPR